MLMLANIFVNEMISKKDLLSFLRKRLKKGILKKINKGLQPITLLFMDVSGRNLLKKSSFVVLTFFDIFHKKSDVF